MSRGSGLLFGQHVVISPTYTDGADVVLAHGDCLALLRQLSDGAVGLVVTSPPYNLNKDYERPASLEEYRAAFTPVVRELVRVLSPTGSLAGRSGT